jgi:kynurenine formamidase
MNAETGTAGAAAVLASLGLPHRGAIYDLSSGWWRHMPNFDGYPRFEVVTYNSPGGQRAERRFPFADDGSNEVEFGCVSELISGSLHTGTHIDALCHVTKGSNDEWHGGVSATDAVGDYGATVGDASALAPIVGRGVLLDIPGLLGIDSLPAGFAVGAEHLGRAATRAGVEVEAGDTVLVRTGQMRYWPDADRARVRRQRRRHHRRAVARRQRSPARRRGHDVLRGPTFRGPREPAPRPSVSVAGARYSHNGVGEL